VYIKYCDFIFAVLHHVMQYTVRSNTANRGPHFANILPLLQQFCVTSLLVISQLAALQHMQPAWKLHLCGAIFDLIPQLFSLTSLGSIYTIKGRNFLKNVRDIKQLFQFSAHLSMQRFFFELQTNPAKCCHPRT